MNYHIYYPNDLLKKKFKLKTNFLIGYHYANVFIVIQHTSRYKFTDSLPEGLKVIGSINYEFPHDLPESFPLHVTYGKTDSYPQIVDDLNRYTIIIFDPPNFKNLEYFSINPILLQSTGLHTKQDVVLKKKLQEYDTNPEQEDLSISSDRILDKINQSLRIRIEYDKWYNSLEKSKVTRQSGPNIAYDSFHKLFLWIRTQIFKILMLIVFVMQYTTIWLIDIINYQFYNGLSLTEILEVFKQLDLRLRQINYFPIQFLLYYDKTIFYSRNSTFLRELEIPFLNSNLNINNSNYINLYNSLWLIVNDILLGVTTYKILLENYDTLTNFLNEYILEKILFFELYRLIEWVSFSHPAGFKLNNELGQFMGDLFLWTLKFWKVLFGDVLTIHDSGHHQLLEHSNEILHYINKLSYFVNGGDLFLVLLKILCYGGFTFLLSAIIDYINIITFHLYSFYYSLAKIYRRQIEIIKSLFQLFRGKKYNILRNRIDSFDLDSHEFEVDQLLLGTLLFIVLIYLIPTTFAFYLIFSIIRLATIITINLIESMITFTNFTPLFVILLKFKNSNRLQGGITLTFVDNSNGVNILKLANKSLTYPEILNNLSTLLQKSNVHQMKVLHKFFNGKLMKINNFTTLKFNYLMLPKHYNKTIEV